MKTIWADSSKILRSRTATAFLTLFIILFIVACGGIRNADTPQDFDELKALVDAREFEIENEWAMPLGRGNMNLIGNPNHIRLKGDSVDIFLPYFGVRHSGGNYGGREGGIIYEGPAEDFNVEAKEEKNRIVVKFQGRHDNENLQFIITLFPGGNAYTSVNSSQRSNISYRGDVKALPEESR